MKWKLGALKIIADPEIEMGRKYAAEQILTGFIHNRPKLGQRSKSRLPVALIDV